MNDQPEGPITRIEPLPRVSRPMRAAGASDVGNVRSLNEDAFIIEERLALWAVADGMGGHDGGDYASAKVVDCLSSVRARSHPRDLLLDVVARLEDANAILREEAEKRQTSTIGSTVVCLLALADRVYIAWAGDSRAYLYRTGTLRQLTRDHTIVQQMVDEGMLDPEKAEDHPHAHVLTRAVGAADAFQLDFEQDMLEKDDLFLLCSDGLSRLLTNDEIEAACADFRTPETLCQDLIDAAKERGAPDNVTVLAIKAA